MPLVEVYFKMNNHASYRNLSDQESIPCKIQLLCDS